MEYCIVLLGTHQFEWAIWPFAELFAKYFGNEKILYFTDKISKELPENLESKIFLNWDWSVDFGEGLKSLCYSHQEEILLIFLLDHWINQPVDRLTIDKLADYMIHHPEVIRANITEDASWHYFEVEHVEDWLGLDIVEIKPWSIHAGLNGGSTFCPSLWRPELLAKMIKSDWNLWDCEKQGTDFIKSNYPNIRVVGSDPCALNRTHGLMHGQRTKVSLSGLKPEDRYIVLKYLPEGFTVC